MFGRWENWLRSLTLKSHPQRNDIASLSTDKLREIKKKADYLSDAVNKAPSGQLSPEDMGRLKAFTDELERINKSK